MKFIVITQNCHGVLKRNAYLRALADGKTDDKTETVFVRKWQWTSANELNSNGKIIFSEK